MKYSLKAFGYRLIIVLLAYLVLTSLTQVIFQGLMRSDHSSNASYVAQRTNLIIASAQQFFNEVSLMPFDINPSADQCSEQTIQRLREVSAKMPPFAIVGAYQNGAVLCDSLRGNDAVTYTESTLDLELLDNVIVSTGIREPLFQNVETLLIQNGQVSLVINPAFVQQDGNTSFHVFYLTDSGDRLYLLGGNGENIPAFAFFPFSAFYGHVTCPENSSICVQSVQSRDQVWTDYQRLLTAKIIVDTALLLLAFLIVNIIRRYWKSPKQRVRRALFGKNSFYFVRQPIVDLKTEAVLGYEVLSRFEDSTGPLYPDEMIPLIRELKQTKKFTYWMLTRVLNEPSMQMLSKDKLIHFNLFPEDMNDLDVDRVSRIIKSSGIRAQVSFEITEDFNFNVGDVSNTLAKLLAMGIPISIDDFGTGYSNLAKLNDLHIHTLKIDRSFVKGMEADGLRSNLIPEITAIAKRLNVLVIAEGVENKEQAMRLKALGVQMAQGWHFGKPTEIASPESQPSTEKSVGHSLTTGYNSK